MINIVHDIAFVAEPIIEIVSSHNGSQTQMLMTRYYYVEFEILMRKFTTFSLFILISIVSIVFVWLFIMGFEKIKPLAKMINIFGVAMIGIVSGTIFSIIFIYYTFLNESNCGILLSEVAVYRNQIYERFNNIFDGYLEFHMWLILIVSALVVSICYTVGAHLNSRTYSEYHSRINKRKTNHRHIKRT